MAELNFLEYNVNPQTHDPENIGISLRGLGFRQLSVSKCGQASMWSVNNCIMLVSTKTNHKTGISGIGFNSENSLDGSVHCSITGLNLAKVNNLNIYTFPIELFRKNYEEHFTTQKLVPSDIALDHFAGVVINNTNINNMHNIIDALKMRTVKKTESYVTTVCENNRFNILWDNNSSDVEIKTIVIATDNIIDTVAEYASLGMKFDDTATTKIDNFYEKNKDDQFVDALPYKTSVKGYGLNIEGKPKSYVLEKMVKTPLPNLNLILSQRYNHNGLNEESIMYYKSISNEDIDRNISTE